MTRQDTTAPLTDAEAALRATSTDGLLTAFASLTHRMHGVDNPRVHTSPLRAQRDLIRAEILRRTGDL